MSTRPTLRPQTVIDSQPMATDIISKPTILGSLTSVSYSLTWTGNTPVGTISVEVSNDFSLDAAGAVANAGTWTALTMSVGGVPTTTIPISGNSGSGFVDIDKTSAYAIRITYNAGSGTGTLSSIVTAKVA